MARHPRSGRTVTGGRRTAHLLSRRGIGRRRCGDVVRHTRTDFGRRRCRSTLSRDSTTLGLVPSSRRTGVVRSGTHGTLSSVTRIGRCLAHTSLFLTRGSCGRTLRRLEGILSFSSRGRITLRGASRVRRRLGGRGQEVSALERVIGRPGGGARSFRGSVMTYGRLLDVSIDGRGG